MSFDRSRMGKCWSRWLQIMKADPQMPEGPVLTGTLMFSELHSLPIASVNLPSVHSYSLPTSLSFFISPWPSLFLPTFMTIIFLWPFIYFLWPHMPREGRSCLGNITKPSSGLNYPRFYLVPLAGQGVHLWCAQEDAKWAPLVNPAFMERNVWNALG